MNKNEFCFFRELTSYIGLPAESEVSMVFNSSFDALFEGCIINFNSNMRALSPLSVFVPQESVESAQIGTKISLTQNSLIIGGQALCFSGFIEHLRALSGKIAPELLTDNVKLLERCIRLFGKGSIIKQTLFEPENALISLNRLNCMFKPKADLMAFMPYVGAGDGLTPSFDDFLAAIIYADAFCKSSYFNLSDQFLAMAKKRTTKQAYQQYMLAANAHFALQFEDFIIALFCKKLKSADILRLLNWGHSSGTDILCGFLFYAWLVLKKICDSSSLQK